MNEFFDSEVFGEYARIALEKGLIKKDAQDASKKPNPRYDSLDLEAIEMLYGIKPNEEDEKHIVERAHPEPVVVAPAYDRLNGLVENQLERQDIMTGIALKPNDGKLVQRRYVVAHDELLNELLKSAFLLDKKGEDELMKLADSCAGRLVKIAILPVIPPAIMLAIKITAWIAAATATYSAVTNHLNLSQGVMIDCDELLEDIQEAIDDYPEESGVLGKLNRLVSDIRAGASHAYNIRQTLGDVVKNTVKQDEEEEVVANFVTGQYDDDIVGFFEDYQEQCQDRLEQLSNHYKKIERVLKKHEGGAGASWWEPLRVVYRQVIPSDLEDIKLGVARLSKSLGDELASIDEDLSEFSGLQSESKKALNQAKKKEKKDKGGAEGLTEELMG